MALFENVTDFMHTHETFFSVVSTVIPWLISAVLGIVQIVNMVRRKMEKSALAEAKKANECCVPQKSIEKLVKIPYVPGENILKLMKVLENQDVGWTLGNDGDSLRFGALSFHRHSGNVTIYHNGTRVDFKSKEPNLDNQLLAQGFSTRFIKEKSRLAAIENRKAEEAVHKAHSEVESLLKQI